MVGSREWVGCGVCDRGVERVWGTVGGVRVCGRGSGMWGGGSHVVGLG